MKTKNKLKIDESGLFFFKSDLTDNRKLEILNWYNSLSQDHREYVDILRREASNETEFFNQPD